MHERVSLLAGRLLTFKLSDLQREEGQGVTEYGLALAFVAVALVGILAILKGDIQGFINKVGTDLSNLPGNL